MSPNRGAGTRGIARVLVKGGGLASTTLSWPIFLLQLDFPGRVIADRKLLVPERPPGGEGKEVGWKEVDPEGRREQSAPGKQLACPPARTVSRSAIAGAGAPAGPARRGESPAATAPPHALPRRRELGAGRGRSWRCLRADPLARVLRCVALSLTARG